MEIIDWVTQQIRTNAFFNGVVGASIITGVSLWVRQIAGKGRTLFSRYCTTSFSVTNENHVLYAFVNEWLKKEKIHKSPRRVVVQAGDKNSSTPISTSDPEPDTSMPLTEVSDVDSYLGWYKRLPVYIEFTMKERDNAPILRVVKVTFYFRGPRWLSKLVAEFSSDASLHFSKSDDITVFSTSHWGGWTMKKMPKRSLDTLFLAPDTRQDILRDLDKFTRSKALYTLIGKPWRRNYLFEGPPGTGKTSLIWALASYLKKDVYVFTDLSKVKSLSAAYEDIRPGSIIVYEDVDCLGVNVKTRDPQEDGDSEPSKGVSMSQFLNTLDGSGALHDSLVFLTTNYPEKLDAALLRKGRVDRRFHMGFMTLQEAQEFSTQSGVLLTDSALSNLAQLQKSPDQILPADLQEFIYQTLFDQQ